MASFFRSISIKIFGMSLALLVSMAVPALWSANLTQQVHLQLRTLNYSLFPLALTLSDLDGAVFAQERHAETALETPDRAAVQKCHETARVQGMAAANLMRKAEALRALGARLAVL